MTKPLTGVLNLEIIVIFDCEGEGKMGSGPIPAYKSLPFTNSKKTNQSTSSLNAIKLDSLLNGID